MRRFIFFSMCLMLVNCKGPDHSPALVPSKVEKDNDSVMNTTTFATIDSSDLKRSNFAVSSFDSIIRAKIYEQFRDSSVQKIVKYKDHYKAQLYDNLRPDDSATFYFDKDLNFVRSVNYSDENPFQWEEFKVHDEKYSTLRHGMIKLTGVDRSEFENHMGTKMLWEKEDDPAIITVMDDGSVWSANKNAMLYTMHIHNTMEELIGVHTRMYILNTFGQKVDSIDFQGEEVWQPRVTEDGNYIAFRKGRVVLEQCSADVDEGLFLIDANTKDVILREWPYKGGNFIGQNGNYFFTVLDNAQTSTSNLTVYDPHERKIYKNDRISYNTRIEGVKWSSVGIYSHKEDEVLLRWKTDFQEFTF